MVKNIALILKFFENSLFSYQLPFEPFEELKADEIDRRGLQKIRVDFSVDSNRWNKNMQVPACFLFETQSVADPGGGPSGPWPPPGPVKIGHKKDGRRRRPHRFHVSRPPPYPAAGSATDNAEIPTHYIHGYTER